MIRQPACPKYPTGVKKRVSGDWNCGRCTNLNFAFRSLCNRCGAQKANSPVFHWALFLTPPSVKDMQAVNAEEDGKEREEIPSLSPFFREKFMIEPTKPRPLLERALFPDCDMESQISEVDVETLLLAEILAGVTPPSKSRRQCDWRCVSCSNLNFAFRSECNRCRSSRPT